MELTKKISNSLLKKVCSDILAIECIELNDTVKNHVIYNAIYVKIVKNKITIESQIQGLNTEELKNWIYDKALSEKPVILNISSSKILHKCVPEVITHPININTYFQSVDNNDFYHQIVQNEEYNESFVTIARKEHVNRLLDSVSFLDKKIISVALGPFHLIKSYASIFHCDNNHVCNINFLNYSFSVSKEKTEYKILPYTREDNLAVSDKIITPNLSLHSIIAYSYSLNYFIDPLNIPAVFIKNIQANKETYFFNKQARVVFAGYLSILFICLIVSSALFTHFHNRQSFLEEKNTMNLLQLEQNEKNKEKLKQREDILARNGLLYNNRMTPSCDEIMHNIPQGIFISKVFFNPEIKKTSKNELLFNKNKIELTGLCYTIVDLHDWINSLKNIDWVNNVVITEYKQLEDREMYEFELDIIKK